MGILHGKRGLIMGVANENLQRGACCDGCRTGADLPLPIRLKGSESGWPSGVFC